MFCVSNHNLILAFDEPNDNITVIYKTNQFTGCRSTLVYTAHCYCLPLSRVYYFRAFYFTGGGRKKN